MKSTPRILRYAAFAVLALVGLIGGVFAAGYAFADLGTLLALGLTAAWVVPLVAMSVAALRWPEASAPWLTVLTLAMVLLVPLARRFHLVPESAGPVLTMAMLALAVPLAFLGLRMAATAGTLLLVLAATQLVGTMIGYLRSPAGEVPLGHLFSGSSGVIILPMLVAGLLFLAAGLAAHERPSLGRVPRLRHGH